ncbi:monooxygenase [Bradyrhizobium cosmicum]|uniref:Monooxygenase n=1 Tax=Bradyrhizobium cosmicum TaxID=1404864 RepID=A0AAI8QF50_9BRAD|nr:monooxygenase [Bradyrhizobium cosmicum]
MSVGRSAPDFEWRDGTTVGERLRRAKGILLDFDARAPLQALAGSWDDRIDYVDVDVKNRLGLNAVLLRPDGIVAWASDGKAEEEEAAQAASRWFGAPRSD